MQLQELQQAMERYKDVPTIEEFIKEALELNSLLMKQQEHFCQKMSRITPYLATSDQLTDKTIDQRTEFTDLNTGISDFIEWQETEDKRNATLPEIEATHKDILFTDWDVRIEQAELLVAREVGVSKNIIKAMNHTLFSTNMVKEDNLKEMPNLGALHKSWQEKVEAQKQEITKLTKTDWDSYWQYLVKMHSQITTLNCSIHSTQ